MARKEYLIQTTTNKKLYDFYKSLSEKDGSVSGWVREALREFAKKNKWDTEKVIEDYETR